MINVVSALRQFRSASQGSVAITVAVLIPIIMLMAGIAIDYSRAHHVKSALQSDADAAVLAAAANIGNTEEGIRRAETYFDAAIISQGLKPLSVKRIFNRDENTGNYSATVNYNLGTTFARVAGLSKFDIAVSSSAAVKAGVRVLDIAMCIDATGSMQPTLDAVKTNAINFESTLNQQFETRKLQQFDAVRIRPIFFRDFGGNFKWYDVVSGGKVDKYPNGFVSRPAGDARNYGDDVSMRAAADFYSLPSQSIAFGNFVSPEIESGGGDDPESGLECLNEAMNSNWTKIGDKVKTVSSSDQKATDVFSVIAIWTDQDTHAPSFSYALLNPNYPPAGVMPRDYSGLLAKWTDASKIPQPNKLVAMFSPDSALNSNWKPVQDWDHYMHAGTLTQGTDQMVSSIADAVATMVAKSAAVRLVN